MSSTIVVNYCDVFVNSLCLSVRLVAGRPETGSRCLHVLQRRHVRRRVAASREVDLRGPTILPIHILSELEDDRMNWHRPSWRLIDRHGQGTYCYNDTGSVYKGTWVNGTMQSAGEYIYSNHRYKGNFANNNVSCGCVLSSQPHFSHITPFPNFVSSTLLSRSNIEVFLIVTTP